MTEPRAISTNEPEWSLVVKAAISKAWHEGYVAGGAEAAAGPRDSMLGPEPESPASAWLEGYKQGRIEAEAAAGPRDPWLDLDGNREARDSDSDTDF